MVESKRNLILICAPDSDPHFSIWEAVIIPDNLLTRSSGARSPAVLQIRVNK